MRPSDRRSFLKKLGTGAASVGMAGVLSSFDVLGNPKKEDDLDIERQDFASQLFSPLSITSIRPQGWLLHQLEIMRDGTTGHLDEVYDKVKIDNGWLGGKGDSWEETPYWLDGAVPLAYLLEDDTLKKKVLKYVNWVIENQRSSGYFGPITKAEREKGVEITIDNCKEGEDWWPKMIMLKVLQQYYSATEDRRVIDFMQKYFRYQLKALKKCPLSHWTQWAEARGYDNILTVQWLYHITKEKYLLELAGLLLSQTFTWNKWFASRDWIIRAAAYQNGEDWMQRHGVNVAMALKAPIIDYRRSGNKEYLKIFETIFHDLMTLHGLPHGMFSADEDLHANDPVQGVELCAVVEAIFSLEQAVAATGNIRYMDQLEKIAFNALPTQTTDDYNKKQYFQIANQVQVCKGVFDFTLPFYREMNNVFGMRSGYTCCLANMHQGWTKFASNLWHRIPGNGLATLIYAPNELKTEVGKEQTKITFKEETSYPFEENIHFTISTSKAVKFPFQLRIPGWCNRAEVFINGKKLSNPEAGTMTKVNRTWQNGDQLILKLPMDIHIADCGRNARAVERGPLVYALKQEERWEKGQDEKEGEYYSVYPKKDWNYGLLKNAIEQPEKHIKIQKIKNVGKNFVWNIANAPIEMKVKAKKIPGWKILNDVAPAPVTDRTGVYRGKVAEEVEEITLIPYGCTKVRVVAFPVVN